MSTFASKQMELCIVGLENAGKTTLMAALSGGDASAPTVPTIGLNVKTARRGKVAFKMWDLAGQASYRSEWGRYASGVDCIVFVVDVSDPARVGIARKELHGLLENSALAHTPICIAANKIDVTPHLTEAELIKELNLDYVVDNAWVVCPICARDKTNVEVVVQWLIRQRKGEATRATESGSVLGASAGRR